MNLIINNLTQPYFFQNLMFLILFNLYFKLEGFSHVFMELT